MPIDHDGNRADIVMDDTSSIARMNIGRLTETFINATCRDVKKWLQKRLNIFNSVSEEFIGSLDGQALTDCYNYLLGLYKIVNDAQYDYFLNLNNEDKIHHITEILNDKVYLYLPIDNQKYILDIIRNIQQHYPPIYGPVEYVGNSGRKVTTKSNVRIAPLYMMLLEKIADTWSSISSGKLQLFGILSMMTKAEKFSYPFRNSAVRTIGETEGRIYAGYCGRHAIAEMMDRSNNTQTQRNMVWNILNADDPGNIENVVDRNIIEYGNTKPLQLVKHIMATSGFEPTYVREDDMSIE